MALPTTRTIEFFLSVQASASVRPPAGTLLLGAEVYSTCGASTTAYAVAESSSVIPSGPDEADLVTVAVTQEMIDEAASDGGAFAGSLVANNVVASQDVGDTAAVWELHPHACTEHTPTYSLCRLSWSAYPCLSLLFGRSTDPLLALSRPMDRHLGHQFESHSPPIPPQNTPLAPS